MAFNRDRNNRGGGGFRSRPSFRERPRFGGNDRGPVEMHRAVCDNCGKECEVPFRPTSGKPVYCSNCFENQRGGSEPRRFEGRNHDRSSSFENKPVFNPGGRDEFKELNAKLDKILNLLSSLGSTEEEVEAPVEVAKPAKVARKKA